MNDPQRLLEREEGFGATLLRAGCEERPSPERVRRTLRAIGIVTVLGSAAGEAAGSGAGAVVSALTGTTAAKVGASSLTLALAAKWVVIGGLGGLVTIGAATELAGPRAREPIANTPVVSTSAPASRTGLNARGTLETTARPAILAHDGAEIAPPPSPASPSVRLNTGAEIPPSDTGANADNAHSTRERLPIREVPALPSAPRMEPASVSQSEAAPSPRAALPGHAFPVARITPSAAQGTTADDDGNAPQSGASELSLRLNNQVALIDSAWAAVKRNDPAAALRALSGYEQTFPALDLHPEVLFLRMTAQTALGQKVGARADGARIVALYPRSVQATRARALLAQP